MFHFKVKIFKAGTSNAIIIPKPVSDFFKLEKGSELILTADDNGIQISPNKKIVVTRGDGTLIVSTDMVRTTQPTRQEIANTSLIEKLQQNPDAMHILEKLIQKPFRPKMPPKLLEESGLFSSAILSLQLLEQNDLIHLNPETRNYEITQEGRNAFSKLENPDIFKKSDFSPEEQQTQRERRKSERQEIDQLIAVSKLQENNQVLSILELLNNEPAQSIDLIAFKLETSKKEIRNLLRKLENENCVFLNPDTSGYEITHVGRAKIKFIEKQAELEENLSKPTSSLNRKAP